MAEIAVQGLLEFWPCKSVNNPNFGLPISQWKSERYGSPKKFPMMALIEIISKWSPRCSATFFISTEAHKLFSGSAIYIDF